MLENSTVNLSALYNSHAKITFFRLSRSCILYADRSMQNATEQFVSCIHIFVNFALHPTSQTEIQRN